MSDEDFALRQAHSLYNEFELEDRTKEDYDPYAEADRLYEAMGDR